MCIRDRNAGSRTIAFQQSLFLSAFALIEFFKAVLRLIFCPNVAELRPFTIHDETARYWSRRLSWLSSLIGYGLIVAVPIISNQVNVQIGALANVIIMPVSYTHLIGALQAGEALWHWSVIPLGLAVAILSTALPYSLEMIALTRLPTRTFGTLMSMEPALAAVSGMIFLGETLTPIQLLALGAIIAASMGSTLTVRKESKIKELDIN